MTSISSEADSRIVDRFEPKWDGADYVSSEASSD
jgi:hypothetical protein